MTVGGQAASLKLHLRPLPLPPLPPLPLLPPLPTPPPRLSTSWRVRRLDETLTAAEALMPRLGISRVTDVTRLDRLGLPVCASIRPRGLTLRVHAGKGLRLEEARVGALMEAIEFAVAEPACSDWAPHRMRAATLSAQLGHGATLADLAPRLGRVIGPDTIVPGVACESLLDGRTVVLPAELVFVPYAPTGAPALFGSTTTGLASGNSLDEATLHGLLEVIERDALALALAGPAARRIDNGSLPEPFRSLAADWLDLGVELSVHRIDNDWALPCFDACLREPASADVNLAGGSGCHPDAGIALARAVCEAAQSRLSHIHGGRDDITRFYAKYRDWAPGARTRAEARHHDRVYPAASEPLAAFAAYERGAGRDADFGPAWLTSVLAGVLERLAGAGFPAVYRHRYGVDLGGLHVVRIVVARCEDAERGSHRIGPRLLARVVGDA